MGNCLLSNSESVCKSYFRLRRIFLQEFLQFLVFEFFRLTRSFSVGQVIIVIAKCLESIFTRFMRHRTFSQGWANHFGHLTCFFFFFFNGNAKKMQCPKCFLSDVIIFTNDFFRMATTYYSVFQSLKFARQNNLKAGENSIPTKSYKTSK